MRQLLLHACAIALGLLVCPAESKSDKTRSVPYQEQMALLLIDTSDSFHDTRDVENIEEAITDMAAYVRQMGSMPYVFWSTDVSNVSLWNGDVTKAPRVRLGGDTLMHKAIQSAHQHQLLCGGVIILVDDAPIESEKAYERELKRVLASGITVFTLLVSDALENPQQYLLDHELVWLKTHRSFSKHPNYQVGTLRKTSLKDAFKWVQARAGPCIS